MRECAVKMLAIPLAWLAGVIAVVAFGFRPDPYLEYARHMPPPHPFPTRTVLWIILFMTLQAGLTVAILRPRSWRRSWARAAAALAVSVGFLGYGAITSMHAPPAHAAYLWWLLLFAGAMAVLLLWSVVAAITASTHA